VRFLRGGRYVGPPFSVVESGFGAAGKKITPLMLCWRVSVAGCGR
jgi:hypothetical protein